MNLNFYFYLFILLHLLSPNLLSQNVTKLKISVMVPEGTSPDKVDVSVPPLKFNKKFIYSHTFEDAPVSLYNRGFTYINKKWVDDQVNYHFGQDRTTGIIPEKTLGYTDGCGNERRFGLGASIFPNAGNQWRGTYMDNPPSTFNNFLNWNDLTPLLDFGSSIYFHSVDERVWDIKNKESILQGLYTDQEKTISKTGRGMKVLMRPNGNNNYVEAAKMHSGIVMMGTEEWGNQYIYYPASASFNLDKAIQSRDYFSAAAASGSALYNRIVTSHNSDNGTWVHFFSHGTGSDNYVINHLTRLNNEYGKDGDDSMWFATLDEVYEYWYMRKNMTITKQVSGQVLTIEIQVPTQDYFYFTDFSLLMKGITTTPPNVTSSDHVYGLSYAVNNGSLLINVDFNTMLVDRAEKYTSLYERSQDTGDRDDAVYFVNQLKKELKNPYLERLGLLVNERNTANDKVTRYDGYFLYGCNSGYLNNNWTDEDVSDLLLGSEEKHWEGLGVNSLRPALYEYFVHRYGYEARIDAFKYYWERGAKNNVAFIGDKPCIEHREKKQYVEGKQSESYENIYEDIWDNGENGTPVNDNNYYALYVYNLVKTYGAYVKFWEIKNEPDYTYASDCANSKPGKECNWWDKDPSALGLHNLCAPIQSYIRMLRVSYEVIKHVDPDAIVCTGGIGYVSFLDAVLRNTDNPDGGKVTEEYPLKGGAWFDCLSYHLYPMYYLSDWVGYNYPGNISGRKYYRHTDAAVDAVMRYKDSFFEVLSKYGYDGVTYPTKEVIITEFNIPNKQVAEYIGSEQAQRDFLIKMAVVAQENDIRALYPYGPWDNKERDSPGREYDYKGMYKPIPNSPGSGALRINESGIGWRTMSNLLKERKFNKEETGRLKLPEGVSGGAFYSDAANDYIYVLWARTSKDMDETASATYRFPIGEDNRLLVTEWNREESIIEGNKIELTGSPVFIRINGEKTIPVPVIDVALSHRSTAIGLRKSLQLAATINPDNAANKNVAWSSSDPSVATVDFIGKVSAVSPGKTIIQVITEDGNKTDFCHLTVRPDSVALSYIQLNPSIKNTTAGDVFKPDVIYSPANATYKGITWSSSDVSVATVDANGVITTHAEGKAVITATPDEGGSKKAKTCTVQVKKGTPVTGISLDIIEKSLGLGETLQLTAGITPSNATTKTVEWFSSDNTVAGVDGKGEVFANAIGTAVITARSVSGYHVATCIIHVNPDPVRMYAAKADLSEESKENILKTASIYPNPTKDFVNLNITGTDIPAGSVIYLYHVSGRLLKQWKHVSETNIIDLSGYPDGIYFIRLMMDGDTQTWKIIKE